MSGFLIWFYVILFFAEICRCAVWEFGVDRKNSMMIMHNRGKMSDTQIAKNVPVKIPKCHKLSYVRVEVMNAETTPQVTFDRDTKKITIDYITSPNTESQYEIIGKGVKEKICVSDEPEPIIRRTTSTTTSSPSANYGVKPLPASYRVSYA